MVHKVAVTGVGGGSGQSILKALMAWNPAIEVYPVDVTPLSAGLFWPGAMPGTVLPKPEEDIGAWKQWVAQTGIKLLIPGSDRDLLPLAAVADEWRQQRICRIAVSDKRMVELANDKAALSTQLQVPTAATFNSPQPHLLSDFVAEHGYPIVVKPRFGAASRGFHLCANEAELHFYIQHTPDPVIQEYLEGDEYTCVLFFDVDHEFRAHFALRRWLRGGDTYRAEVVDDPMLNAFLRDVGRKLRPFNPFGPINVQLRLVPGRGPVIFELNARCSGTTAMRAHFGYNEPKILVQHILDRLPVTQPRTRKGFAFRYWQELYLEQVDENAIFTNRLYKERGIT